MSESDFDRTRGKIYRRGPKDIKFGRTFNRLSRYDLLLAARIHCQDVEKVYKMSDEEFNRWVIMGKMP